MAEAGGPVVRLAPAKLNLTLAVVGRRRDGFHDLHSVMVPLALADRLSLAPAGGPADSLRVEGHDAGPVGENLVLRAIGAARSAVGRAVAAGPLAARLEKHIPVAAGLGGGSADAAAAVDAALEAWGVTATDRPGIAAGIAPRLGSDVPFFLAGGAALVEGRGERVRALPPVGGEVLGVVLVCPAVPAPTPSVFAALDAGARGGDAAATRLTSEHLAAELLQGLTGPRLLDRAGILASANDLAAAAAVVVPGLRELRRGLVRRLGRPVGQSGSGPACGSSILRSRRQRPPRPTSGPGSPTARSWRPGPVRRPSSPRSSRRPRRRRDRHEEGSDMTRQAVSTSGAPTVIAPYSQAIVSGDLVFCSGQIGTDPATGELVEGGIRDQVGRALRNLTAVLDAAGCSWDDVLKTTIFLADIGDYAAVNEAYGAVMPEPPPARSTFAVGALPKGAMVEIEAIARRRS